MCGTIYITKLENTPNINPGSSPFLEPTCLSGDVRLAGGENPNEGTVEVCVENRWEGSICDEGWDNADAAVLCRQLGLEGGGEPS